MNFPPKLAVFVCLRPFLMVGQCEIMLLPNLTQSKFNIKTLAKNRASEKLSLLVVSNDAASKESKVRYILFLPIDLRIQGFSPFHKTRNLCPAHCTTACFFLSCQFNLVPTSPLGTGAPPYWIHQYRRIQNNGNKSRIQM